MRFNSLAARLVLLAILSLGLALGTISFVLGNQFNRYFENRIYSELAAHLDQLTANMDFNAEGDVVVSPLLDPHFEAPFSGLYWQVRYAEHPTVVSRSLWTGRIDVPAPDSAGVLVRMALPSSMGEPLLALSRSLTVGDEAAPGLVVLTVATDQSEVQLAASGFRSTMLRWMLIIFVGLFTAAWVQVKLGLAPLENLRQKVEKVRSGKVRRLEGGFPTEVQPLASEVNELLELHDETVLQARERASDLAHGLKTPLTIINTIARDLDKAGQTTAAEELNSQVASMSHFIERELARVRSRTAGQSQSLAYPVAKKMLNAIKRFPRETPLTWHLDMAEDFTTPFDAHDLSELLGNLLDNARKWASATVQLSAGTKPDGTHFILVEDDGAGVEQGALEQLGKRGQRLDPSAQGSGLGLAICADLATHYGADLVLDRASLGGLAVSVSWR